MLSQSHRASCRPVTALLVLLAGWSQGAAYAAAIEKWIDRDGHVYYGDRAPAWARPAPLTVHPNVIETDPVATKTSRDKQITIPQAPIKQSSTKARRDREDIRTYIEQCRNNRGVDCEREARAMIDGPATVLFPGDPLIFPRPDLRPSPPPPRAETPARH